MTEDSEAAPQPSTPEQAPGEGESSSSPVDNVHHPAKVMRIATMVRQLLEEVRHSSLDEAGRSRLADIYETSVRELGEVLAPELKDELARLSLPFNGESPTDSELRIAHAQLVGWLEGLFHGIQAMLFAQHAESQARFEEVRRRSLPAGEDAPPHQPGQYL